MKRTDPVAAFAAARNLGRIERRLQLRGDIDLPNAEQARPELCLTDKSVWLVAALDAERGVAIDLLERDDLRYQPRRLTSQIELADLRLMVPAGRSEQATELLGVAGLRRGAHRLGPPLRPARHVEAPNELERLFLSALLERDEMLLAWLGTSTERDLASPILGHARVRLRFLMTDVRMALVALSPVGDSEVLPIAPAPLRVTRAGRKLALRVHEHEWRSGTNHQLFVEVAEAAGLTGAERLREIARLNWIHRAKEGSPALVEPLLTRAIGLGDPLAHLIRWLLGAELGHTREPREQMTSAIDALLKTKPDRGFLADTWERWEFGAQAGLELVMLLREPCPTEPLALELHARARARRVSEATDPSDRALSDIALAEHLMEVGEYARARQLLEARLGELPSEALEDLLPRRDADLASGAGGQTLRIRIYTLLARARGGSGGLDGAALAELARLQPLVAERVTELARRADTDVAERAAAVVCLLERGGLATPRSSIPPVGDAAFALPSALIVRTLKHPLARDDSAFIGKLQALLALVPAPDPAHLSDYCERLTSERYADALAAVDRTTRVLGVTKMEAYVSRGSKAIGVRAYEHAPPFVLVGGRHVDPDDPFFMTPSELCFALAAEIAHLRFGHTRVTSSEVWAGALSKTKDGLDLVLSILPALKGIRLADRASKIAAKLPLEAVRRAVGEASRVVELLKDNSNGEPRATPHDSVLSRINEELVAAHRLMQLTADRAGLLLVQDPVAAVRAMMLVRLDYGERLQKMQDVALGELLGERDPRGRIAYQDLAVRIAAMLSFYLSDDFALLARALRETGR